MKRVFITGGAGALGNALVDRLLKNPFIERIAVYSRDEHKHARMAARLGINIQGDGSPVRFFLGDVRDANRLQYAMAGFDTVIHAAALKVVPSGEYNPMEFVATNVYGAQNVAMAAISNGVETVVGVSTDKACAPVNLYGATKLAAEKVLLASNRYSGNRTSFRVCRYGNVTGSTSSVVPLWVPMVKNRNPLPMTHPDMTRFWMTLDDAVSFVLKVAEEGDDSCVHVPVLRAYVLSELGKAVWHLFWEGDLPAFDMVGVREGEKMHESMVSPDEAEWCYFDTQQLWYLVSPYRDLEHTLCRPVREGFTMSSEDAVKMPEDELTHILRNLGWGP